MRHLNLDQLAALREIIDQGSFSAAAKRLNLTQPAVSLQIRELEARLGVTLIERLGRRAYPTAIGREVLDQARRLLDEAETLERLARARAGDIFGRVRIGTGATASIYSLPPYLQEIKQKYPGIEVVLSISSSPRIEQAVENNQLDLAFLSMPVDSRKLNCEVVGSDRLVCIAAPEDHLPKSGISAAELVAGPFIYYDAGGHTRLTLDRYFAELGITARPLMELGSVEAVKKMVAVGLGRGVTPAIAVAAEVSRGELQAVPLRPSLSRQLALVLRHDKPSNPALDAALTILRKMKREKQVKVRQTQGA